MIIYNSAAGFEVDFKGTMLGMRYKEELIGKANLTGEGYIGIFTDGANDASKSFNVLKSTENITQFNVCENLENGQHSIKVLKCTEAAAAVISVYEIYTDGYFIEPKGKPVRKIEIYGDSISAGRAARKAAGGNENNSTSQENALLTYASYSALNLNAQTSLFCMSGSCSGVYSNLTDSNPVVKNFEKYSPVSEEIWDFSKYIPDVVVIDLGTNDILGASSQADFEIEFERQYKAFVSKIRDKYPETYIILCYGTYSGSVDFTAYSQVYKNIAESFADGKVFCLQFNPCSLSHPSYIENKVYGSILSEKIKTITGWDD